MTYDLDLWPELEAVLKYREAHDCAAVMMPIMPFWNSQNKTEAEKAHIINRAQTLQAGIRMPYEEKLVHTEKVLKIALEQPVSWAVSYSGGSDSTMLSHLMVERLGLKLTHVMSNTRMEYPETIKMANYWYGRLRAQGVDCHTVFPEHRPNVLWKKIGVPLWSKEIAYKYRKFLASDSDKIPSHVPENLWASFRRLKGLGIKVTDKCCDELKKKPMKKWDKLHKITGHFTGIRCAESRPRRLMWLQRGAVYNSVMHKMWMAHPLVFWTKDEITRYLVEHDIPMLRPNTVRGGSGCVACLFGCHLAAREGEPNALQQLKVSNEKAWKAALDEWGYRDVLDLLEIPYE